MKGKKAKKSIPLEGFYQPYDPPGFIPQSKPPQHSQFVHPGSIPALNCQSHSSSQHYGGYMHHYYNQGSPAAPNPFIHPQHQTNQPAQASQHPQPQPSFNTSHPHPSQISVVHQNYSPYTQQSSLSFSNHTAFDPYSQYVNHVYHPNPTYDQIGIRQYLEAAETRFECAECDKRRKDDKRAGWCDQCGKFTKTIKISGL
ncbi:hypothetical protein I203_103028 [Kwoniella mangroviensis CBS 8507]|uniref:uncharacterized protein n=1 Tax=Kwoniella mangroviensis CBS 8507 TaxID=1296122 RepID=UPI00080D3880|nr:uncharacterized protein I203_04005 [Kwoniella mangroviensis CBS 8507]OCF67315.1 hypothetical protein I203_04005 [Kwoniella mangroviensis CBS 8507]